MEGGKSRLHSHLLFLLLGHVMIGRWAWGGLSWRLGGRGPLLWRRERDTLVLIAARRISEALVLVQILARYTTTIQKGRTSW
jgi:hypothetical protein